MSQRLALSISLLLAAASPLRAVMLNARQSPDNIVLINNSSGSYWCVIRLVHRGCDVPTDVFQSMIMPRWPLDLPLSLIMIPSRLKCTAGTQTPTSVRAKHQAAHKPTVPNPRSHRPSKASSPPTSGATWSSRAGSAALPAHASSNASF